jgi:hypothetical protein
VGFSEKAFRFIGTVWLDFQSSGFEIKEFHLRHWFTPFSRDISCFLFRCGGPPLWTTQRGCSATTQWCQLYHRVVLDMSIVSYTTASSSTCQLSVILPNRPRHVNCQLYHRVVLDMSIVSYTTESSSTCQLSVIPLSRPRHGNCQLYYRIVLAMSIVSYTTESSSTCQLSVIPPSRPRHVNCQLYHRVALDMSIVSYTTESSSTFFFKKNGQILSMMTSSTYST